MTTLKEPCMGRSQQQLWLKESESLEGPVYEQSNAPGGRPKADLN